MGKERLTSLSTLRCLDIDVKAQDASSITEQNRTDNRRTNSPCLFGMVQRATRLYRLDGARGKLISAVQSTLVICMTEPRKRIDNPNKKSARGRQNFPQGRKDVSISERMNGNTRTHRRTKVTGWALQKKRCCGLK